MASDRNETIRVTLGSVTDKELIRFAARRCVEQDAADQLTEVSLEDGMVAGIEFLLRQPLPGELPEDLPDPVLDAARDELRARIALKFGESGVLNG